MGLPTPGTNQLQVLRAVEDGWQAFCRAPWPFLLFQVLALVIAALAVAVGMAARDWFVGALAAVGLSAIPAEGWAGCRCTIGWCRGCPRAAGPKQRRHPTHA